MADRTHIEWADTTFNPWIGCTKVGPGCDHCYAEADFDLRKHRAKWGPGNPRSRTSPANWKKPLQWNAKPFYECRCCGWRGDSSDREFTSPRQGCIHDLMPARRRVFCASLADVFDNEVPAEWRADLFALIEKTKNLDWLLLTKRIGNVTRMIEEATDLIDYGEGWQSLWGQGQWPDHVLLGATICNQPEADRDIAKLLTVPAAVRWISAEPLLGAIDLTRLPEDTCASECCGMQRLNALTGQSICDLSQQEFDRNARIDWVVGGFESGPNARAGHPDWARHLRDQCKDAGVPFLWKQNGEWAPADAFQIDNKKYPEAWLHIDGQQFGPNMGTRYINWNEGDEVLFRVGKKAAGRLLDGVKHDAYPEAPR